jgi:hypothetical protein
MPPGMKKQVRNEKINLNINDNLSAIRIYAPERQQEKNAKTCTFVQYQS